MKIFYISPDLRDASSRTDGFWCRSWNKPPLKFFMNYVCIKLYRCQPLFIDETLTCLRLHPRRAFAVPSNEKCAFFSYTTYVKTHWRFLPEVSHICLSVATNRLNAVEDDRGWWYAASLFMSIYFMLITFAQRWFSNRSIPTIVTKRNVIGVDKSIFNSSSFHKRNGW